MDTLVFLVEVPRPVRLEVPIADQGAEPENRLAFTLGWWGWQAAFLGIVLGLTFTGLAAVALLATGRTGPADALPHGPFLVLGTLTVLVLVIR